MLYIPNHSNCNNCGECCGPVPIDSIELEQIKKHLDSLDKVYIRYVLGQSKGLLTCPFRDLANKCCIIYNSRPTICRLFGVTKGMSCKYGNSHNIDAISFITQSKSLNNMLKAINYAKVISK